MLSAKKGGEELPAFSLSFLVSDISVQKYRRRHNLSFAHCQERASEHGGFGGFGVGASGGEQGRLVLSIDSEREELGRDRREGKAEAKLRRRERLPFYRGRTSADRGEALVAAQASPVARCFPGSEKRLRPL